MFHPSRVHYSLKSKRRESETIRVLGYLIGEKGTPLSVPLTVAPERKGSAEEVLPSKIPETVDSKPFLVLAEDNPADVFLVGRAIEASKVPVNLMVFEDGEAALEYLEKVESDPTMSCPRLLLLDLNLPRQSGTDVLRRARASKRFKNVPVVIFTSSDAPKDRETAARLGADRYFLKPTYYEDFLKLGGVINELLARRGQS
jgi:CheY-like chemotaxis protein